MNNLNDKYLKYKMLYLKQKNIMLNQMGGQKKKFTISSMFEDGQYIQKEYTCDAGKGEEVEGKGEGEGEEVVKEEMIPNIYWKGVPKDAKSLALVIRDPDAKEVVGKEWIHLLTYDIEPKDNDQGIVIGTAGINTRGDTDYQGPCPPKKEPFIHHYIFELYALNKKINKDRLNYEQFQKEIKNNVIDKATLTGLYQRQ